MRLWCEPKQKRGSRAAALRKRESPRRFLPFVEGFAVLTLGCVRLEIFAARELAEVFSGDAGSDAAEESSSGRVGGLR
jgi:hypothetical protein